MSEPRRVKLRIRGRVQGVGFRYGTVREARRLGVTGWVRNTRNGDVEIVAEGSEEDLGRLVSWCQSGPPGARVENVDESWEAATGEFPDFETRW